MFARGARAARGPSKASKASRILANLKGHVLFCQRMLLLNLITPSNLDFFIFKIFFSIIFLSYSKEILENLKRLDFLSKFW